VSCIIIFGKLSFRVVFNLAERRPAILKLLYGNRKSTASVVKRDVVIVLTTLRLWLFHSKIWTVVSYTNKQFHRKNHRPSDTRAGTYTLASLGHCWQGRRYFFFLNSSRRSWDRTDRQTPDRRFTLCRGAIYITTRVSVCQFLCMYVCNDVRSRSWKNHFSKLYEIFHTYHLRRWNGSALTTNKYAAYFRLRGWRHAFCSHNGTWIRYRPIVVNFQRIRCRVPCLWLCRRTRGHQIAHRDRVRSVLSTIAADCVIISAKDSVKETHEFAFLVRLIFLLNSQTVEFFICSVQALICMQ